MEKAKLHSGVFVQERLLPEKGSLEHKRANSLDSGGGPMTPIPFIRNGAHIDPREERGGQEAPELNTGIALDTT